MRLSHVTACRAVSVVALFLTCHAANAQAGEGGERPLTIDLREATERALRESPVLRAARLELQAEQARRDATALTTPYVLGAELENVAGTGSLSGVDGAEATMQVSRVIELGDKREARGYLGDARVEFASIEAETASLQLAAHVARRYLELLAWQARLDVFERAQVINRETLELVEKRVAAGRTSSAELDAARVSLELADLEKQQAQFAVEAWQVALATLWGSDQPDFERVAGTAGRLPPLPAFASFESRLLANPDLRQLQTRKRILDAATAVAHAEQSPDLQVGAGVRYLAGPEDAAFTLSFSVPFGSKSRAEPGIREANATAARLPQEREARLLEIRAEIFGRYQALRAAHLEFRRLNDEIIPRAEQAVRTYRRGFELGSYRLLELTAAQERLIALETEALNAAVEFHRTYIDIETLLGSHQPGGALQ
jgi:cobalt-zinc-cadmium efflux system outer membrane protein